MKPLTAIVHLLLLLILWSACSKNVTPTPAAVLPPVDSTHLPGGGDNGNGDGNGDGDDLTPITRSFEFTKVPIVDKAILNSLFLGAVITKTDSKSLLQPGFVSIDDSYRKPVYIYTDIPMDDFYLKNVLPSKATDNILLGNIHKVFDNGVGQVGSISMGSAEAFGLRMNDLRGWLGVNQDLNALFDLGFPDTAKLAEDKGRVLLSFSVDKGSIMLEAPIYIPYLTIDSTNQAWLTLFGTNQPQVVSSITYGTSVYLIMESDSSAEQLKVALNRCFQQPAPDIVSGAAFLKLSSDDQAILRKSKAYGYSLGQGSLPRDGEKALSYYATAAVEASDPHKLGNPIYYYLNSLVGYETFKYQFEVTSYPQMIRQ